MANTVDPVLQSQRTAETITDPLIRALYFGTDGTPGFYNQLQQAGANLIGSDVPLQQTAGLDPLETQARQRAQAGLGAFQPFFTQQQDLVNQAIEQSRRSEQLQDPYFTQAQDLIQGTVGAYDPSMTEQFYNPYESAVVQQTIDDVMKAGDQQDIAARAQAISAGGESAFGSRARLGAEERREALGRGLGDALSNIRARGFSQAQQTGMGEFARQRQAERAAAHGDINLITLLMGAQGKGLQVQKNTGEWVDAIAQPDELMINVGDMLSRHTNNKLKSTIHRVINPPKELWGTSRYSIPFFMHPVGDMKLDVLDSCISESDPKQFDDITAGEFLHERLLELGLVKE